MLQSEGDLIIYKDAKGYTYQRENSYRLDQNEALTVP